MRITSASASLAENAIEIHYKGKYAYAAALVDQDGGTDNSPKLSLGVSDTSLSAAASAAQEVVAVADSDMTIKKIIRLVRAHYDTTSSREVIEGDFMCRQLHSLEDDTPYHAATSKFEDDAGTTNNLRDGWHGVLTWDNDAASTGFVSLRLPPVGMLNSQVVVKMTSGLANNNSGSDSVTRALYKYDGTLLKSVTVASATATNVQSAWGNEYTPIFRPYPVVLRETDATAGNVATCTLAVEWGLSKPRD